MIFRDAMNDAGSNRNGLADHDAFRGTRETIFFAKGSAFFENIERLLKGSSLQERSSEIFHIVTIHGTDASGATHAIGKEPGVTHINLRTVKADGLVKFRLQNRHRSRDAKDLCHFENIGRTDTRYIDAGHLGQFDDGGAFGVHCRRFCLVEFPIVMD